MKWLNAALDYIPRWLQFQLRYHEQPGCVAAIAYRGEVVFEQAFGSADLAARKRLTPRHRCRVASQSKPEQQEDGIGRALRLPDRAPVGAGFETGDVLDRERACLVELHDACEVRGGGREM